MSDASKYPAYKWQTNGVMVLVNGIEDDDPALLDHHPADDAKGGPGMTTTKFTRDDMVNLLMQGHVDHDPTAPLKELRATLTDALTAAVQARNLDLPSGADAESLYTILQANPQ